MIYKKDPQQVPLFDPFLGLFSGIARNRLLDGWQEVFRRLLLQLMPVDQIERRFSPGVGRPTKELYSMAGLLFLMEFHDWTIDQAVDAYMFRTDVQYALNLEPSRASLCTRTLERYRKDFLENDLAIRVMDDVTKALVDALGTDFSQQRLDSTQVKSNMATFGRVRLFGVTIKRFLTQVKRHDPLGFEGLPLELRNRYEVCESRLFAGSDSAQRKILLQQAAEDLFWLIEHFDGAANHKNRASFKALVRLFAEQCSLSEQNKVEVIAKTNGEVMQNPSDPDASYSGHKGAGYSAHFSETYSDENEVQLITEVHVTGAAEHDSGAVSPVLDGLEEKALLPEQMLADTAYGSDENVQAAAERGVDLQSPCAGAKETKDPFDLSIDDFSIDPETNEVKLCPAGMAPLSSTFDAEKGVTTTYMPEDACAGCRFSAECPIKRVCGEFRLTHTPKEQRLEERRREQATREFRETYRKRAGGESLNAGLKQKMGLRRLRVRGLAKVRNAIYLRAAGWNLLRAAASAKLREKLREEREELQKQRTGAKMLYGRALSRQEEPIEWVPQADRYAQFRWKLAA